MGETVTEKLSNGLLLIGKPRKPPDYDIWKDLNQSYCNQGGMFLYTYCPCPGDVPGITDITNQRHGEPLMNTSCGLDFEEFHKNHSKIGVCKSTNEVIIGGNNHHPSSQGARGGLFVVIDSPQLADSLRCLLK